MPRPGAGLPHAHENPTMHPLRILYLPRSSLHLWVYVNSRQSHFPLGGFAVWHIPIQQPLQTLGCITTTAGFSCFRMLLYRRDLYSFYFASIFLCISSIMTCQWAWCWEPECVSMGVATEPLGAFFCWEGTSIQCSTCLKNDFSRQQPRKFGHPIQGPVGANCSTEDRNW